MNNPYSSVSPAGRLLDAIIERCAVGETIAPGNRTWAKWLGLSSIGSIPDYLAQLVADEWITYDPRGGKITLLRTPYADTSPSRSAGAYDDYDPYLDHPDDVTDYLMSLPRQRPRSGGAK